jgi:PGF-pre-PGF domain-containing protein
MGAEKIMAVSVLGLLLMAGVASGATISSCQEINQSGVYQLTANITNSSATGCINITVSDVVLDGQGFTIGGVGNTNTYGVYVYMALRTLTNVTVKNLEVTDWWYGIYYQYATNGSVENCTAHFNTYGIFLYRSSKNNTVTGNNASYNSQYGIGTGLVADRNVITGNTIADNSKGIFLGTDNNTVRDNVVTQTTSSSGIYLSSADYNILSNNTLTGTRASGTYGIYLTSSKYNRVENNTINLSYYGIYLSSWSDSNNVTGNTIIRSDAGIYICSASASNPTRFNTVAYNTIDGEGYTGSGVYVLKSSDQTIANNTLTRHTVAGIQLIESSNNTISSNNCSYTDSTNGHGDGIRLYHSNNNTILDNLALYNVEYGVHLWNSTGNTITSNNASYNDHYGYDPWAAGIYLSESGNSTISENIVDSNGYWGIFIHASNNTNLTNNTARGNTVYDYYFNVTSEVDCSNYAFNNIGTNNLPWKYHNTQVTLSNMTLSGLFLCNADESSLTNITVIGLESSKKNGLVAVLTDNTTYSKITSVYAYFGILFDRSNNNSIHNSNISYNEYGISLNSSENNSISSSTFAFNKYPMWLDSSNNNTLSENTIRATTDYYYGVKVYYSNKNTLSYNTFFKTKEAVDLVSSNNTLVAHNNLSNTLNGIILSSSSNNTILNNTAKSNTWYGIQIYATSHENKVTNNTASGHRYGGISVCGDNNTLRGNNVSDNGRGIYICGSNNSLIDNTANYNRYRSFSYYRGTGIYLAYSADNNTIINSTASYNDRGIHFWSSGDNILINNTIKANVETGVLFERYYLHPDKAKGNNLSQNTITDNPFGVYIKEWDGAILENNTITGGFYGIYVVKSNTSNITENTIADNRYYSVSLWNASTNNYILDNDIRENYFGVYLVRSNDNTIANNSFQSSYYFNVVNRNSTGNSISGDAITQRAYTKDVHGTWIYSTYLVISTDNQSKATFTLTFENMGNVPDTTDVTISNPDGADYTFVDPDNPSSPATSFILDPGISAERELNVSSTTVGAYHINITVTSQTDPNATDTIEILTIVHGDDHPDSAIVNSTTTDSTLSYSVIEDSVVTNSNVSYCEIYNSTVVNTSLDHVVLRNSLVMDGVITNGTIRKNGVDYNITSNISLSDLVIGTDLEDSTLFGMTEANRTLDFNSSDSNLSFRIATASDYIGGSMTVQRSSLEPSGTGNMTGNLGGYSWIEPSANVEEGMEWVLMKIYYNESELGNISEEDLRFQFFNTTTQEWEYLNKTFVDDFATDTAWSNISGTWSASAGRYGGNSTGLAISVTNETVTGGNTYIQVRFNITNASGENGLVVFSYSNSSHFYYAGIRNHTVFSTANSTHRTYYTNSTFDWVIGYYNGSWNDAVSSTEAINQQTEYFVEVFIRDGNVSLAANGKKKANCTFPSLPSGNLGVALYNTTTYFDDFTVYHPLSGVNTQENYVWGNSTHFSVYGIQSSVYGISSSVYGVSGRVVSIQTPGNKNPPSSGGGGGGSAKGVTIKRINAGGTLPALFNLEDTGFITQIAITARDTVYNVKVIAVPLEKKPYPSMPDPAGTVLSYLKLTKSGISNTQMEKAEVRFQVPISWLGDNDINQETVSLQRDATNKWETLETEYLSEDDEYAYYAATTPTFSYFVITGEPGSGYTRPAPGEEEPIVHDITTEYEVPTPPPTTVPPVKAVVPAKKAEEPPKEKPSEEEKNGICGPSVLLLLSVIIPALKGRRMDEP